MTIAVIHMNDGQDDIHSDIERWENDGGRNVHASGNCIKDYSD